MKRVNNEIDKELFSKFNNDVFPPSLYEFSMKISKGFLDKIKAFIISKNSDDKKLNSLFMFHKETSKYLEGWPTNKKPLNRSPQKNRGKNE